MACPAPSLRLTLCNTLVPDAEFLVLACIVASACAFTKSMPLMSRSKLAMSKQLETPRIAMSLETSSLEQVTQTLAGVVAVDGGTSEGSADRTRGTLSSSYSTDGHTTLCSRSQPASTSSSALSSPSFSACSSRAFSLSSCECRATIGHQPSNIRITSNIRSRLRPLFDPRTRTRARLARLTLSPNPTPRDLHMASKAMCSSAHLHLSKRGAPPMWAQVRAVRGPGHRGLLPPAGLHRRRAI